MEYPDKLYPERKKAREATLKKREEQLAKDRQVLDNCFSTPGGEHALKWLMKKCGYQTANADFRDGVLSRDALIYREANRQLYLEIRKHINKETLKKVEVE